MQIGEKVFIDMPRGCMYHIAVGVGNHIQQVYCIRIGRFLFICNRSLSIAGHYDNGHEHNLANGPIMVTPFSGEGDIEVQVLLGWLWNMDIFSADPSLGLPNPCVRCSLELVVRVFSSVLQF